MIASLCRSFRSSLLTQRIESFLVPQPGEGIAEITIKSWLVSAGTQVQEFEKLCEAFTDKSSIEIKSPFTGTLKQILHPNEAVVKVGEALFTIEVPDPPKQVKKVSPSAKTLAKRLKIDLSSINKALITKEDILEISNQSASSDSPAGSSPKGRQDQPSLKQSISSSDTILKLSQTQSSMLASTTLSLIIPHLSYCEDIEMNNLRSLKNQLRSNLKEMKFTYMPFFLKAFSLAIYDFPIINSVLMSSQSEYLQKSSHDIAIAMDTPKGLLFPVIKQVQSKSIYQLALDLNRLYQLSLSAQLLDSDLSESTITLSNIGSIGGIYSPHIIRSPQVFIGAFGAVKSRLKKQENEFREIDFIPTTWSADHRLIDGATTARFVARFKGLLENPSLMLLNLK